MQHWWWNDDNSTDHDCSRTSIIDWNNIKFVYLSTLKQINQVEVKG